MIGLLFDHNADANMQNTDRDVVLRLKTIRGCGVDIVKLLARKGALVDITHQSGSMVLQFAICLN